MPIPVLAVALELEPVMISICMQLLTTRTEVRGGFAVAVIRRWNLAWTAGGELDAGKSRPTVGSYANIPKKTKK